MKTNRLILLLAGLLSLSTSAMAANVGDVPVHRPLMEEYTGTWCGWCVRGLVGMELLREAYGDEFCGVAYHNDDPMQITTSYPNNVSGFPSAYIDRTSSVDPFYGFGNESAGILNAMQQFANQSATAGIDVTAQWVDEDRTAITVDVTTYFTTDVSNANYGIVVMLIADDLYGTGSSWNQVNYYAYSQIAPTYANDRFLGPWTKKPTSVSGIHFNDVLVGTSNIIANSLPTTIVAYEDYSLNYTFTLSKLPKPALIQNKDNLHVVVTVVNRTNKRSFNSNRCFIDAWAPEPVIVPGDVNGDESINIEDVTRLINYLLNGDAEGLNLANADLNGDEVISIVDVTTLINILLYGEPEE